MMWQPIETAKTGERVKLGWWDMRYGASEPIWRAEAGVAWRSAWFGLSRAREDCDDATHWQPLPGPPQSP